ncbi:MAG: class I SAM-dependent methyltransferase [Deltaproteobacteria bacterium]|jgi:SAM-dependent methyltransferase|nr:class I SAM-dependent methyltransferase [Deltaproteobacteria bacterium]
MDKPPAGQADFWDRRAASFPRYNEVPGSYEETVLAQAEAGGVDFRGRTVLDVGAGSGQFTLKLAQRAARVVALDISEKMLGISRADALAHGLSNIDYVLAPFPGFPPGRRFDVVFCSMCPAVRDDQSRQRLLDLAGGALVHVGFRDYSEPGPMARLIGHYGLERKLFRSGPEMRRWMEARGETFKSFHLAGEWEVRHSRAEALAWCRTMLLDYGVERPDEGLILELLEPFWDPAAGSHVFRTPYSVELLVHGCPRQPAGAGQR